MHFFALAVSHTYLGSVLPQRDTLDSQGCWWKRKALTSEGPETAILNWQLSRGTRLLAAPHAAILPGGGRDHLLS